MIVQLPPTKPIIYPDDDGLPMSNNTEQFNWIVTIKENLEYLFAQNPNVFVAGDLLWYPVEGSNTICNAPDVMVVFGSPKGRRGSYMQWQEGGIAPQVVFEILSPGNRSGEMAKKLKFYDRHGVEEYYLYDPDRNDLTGWQRTTDDFELIENMHGWVSPRLGIRFELSPELILYFPDGSEFSDYQAERQKAELERQRAELEHQRANQAERETVKERQRADQLAERLRSLGIEI
jgi:Uma2 family endonuclease